MALEEEPPKLKAGRFALSVSSEALPIELGYELESPCNARFVTGSVDGMVVLVLDLDAGVKSKVVLG